MHWLLSILSCASSGTAPDTVPVAEGDVDLIAGDPVPCEAPRTSPSWTEVGAEAGLASALDPDAYHIDGGGLVVADLDQDGVRDLVVGFWDEVPVVYRGDGSAFRAEPLGEQPHNGQLTVVDLDGDGWLDLLVSGGGARLYRGGPDGFGPDTETLSALVDRDTHLREWLVADIDGDGLLDVIAIRSSPHGDPDAMTDLVGWGRADGGFDREELPVALSGRLAFDGVLLDVEDDGDLDLYVVNDQGSVYGGNVLWRNEGGRALVDGREGCGCDRVHEGMGGSVGDYDGDGLQDLYLTATASSVLLRGRGDGVFTDWTVVAGADPVEGHLAMGWGSGWGDVDDDGDLDLLVAQGDLTHEGADLAQMELPLDLLRQDDGVFTRITEEAGLPTTGSWRAVALFDWNGDGALDLLGTDVVERPRLYASDGCLAGSWLEVDAPAYSRVTVTAGGRTWVRIADPDPGFAVSTTPSARFGLGEVQSVDRIEVELPDGRWGAITAPLAARRVVRVQER